MLAWWNGGWGKNWAQLWTCWLERLYGSIRWSYFEGKGKSSLRMWGEQWTSVQDYPERKKFSKWEYEFAYVCERELEADCTVGAFFFLILFWPCWVLVAAWGNFSCNAPLYGTQASEHSSSVPHPPPCGILVSWPGTKPGSLALEGRFLTTGLPGKSQVGIYFNINSIHTHSHFLL